MSRWWLLVVVFVSACATGRVPEVRFANAPVVFPLVGAVIGAVTNQIAIRMLFRPFKPILLGNWQLPFTPGVIPRKQGEIAKNIAASFEKNLLSGDDTKRLQGPLRTTPFQRRWMRC